MQKNKRSSIKFILQIVVDIPRLSVVAYHRTKCLTTLVASDHTRQVIEQKEESMRRYRLIGLV